ncbi:hypothetical protein B0H11DRAFT_507274 [Mycena galericulata]|nr:hypothetical protein B0H11DRAFT_507274 [Mycena galericulata]
MSHPSTVLPPSRLRSDHTYGDLTSNPANRLIYRAHAPTGRGSLTNIGFLSSSWPTRIQVESAAAFSHVTQWRDGTTHSPTPFVSATFSLAHALFEAGRLNARHRCTDTLISIIDTAKIPNTAWLATEFVGTSGSDAAFFARAAQEVLVYDCIPFESVVVTLQLDDFLQCLPRWCDNVGHQIRWNQFRSTEDVVHALAYAASLPANNTLGEDSALMMQSVDQSIRMLKKTLPAFMADYDRAVHANAVDEIARLAALFAWWPRWITGVDPTEYHFYLQRASNAIRIKMDWSSLQSSQ